MAVKTLSAVLRGKTTIDNFLDGILGGQRAAFALLLFMRFVEDNAEALGVKLDPDDPDQENIVELCSRFGENRFYSRSSIDPDAIWVGIASQLGFERRGFGDFLNNISDHALASACELCDLEAGCLSAGEGETVRRATRAIHTILTSLFDDVDHIPRTYADIATGIVSAYVEGEKQLAVCIPTVGQSDLAVSFARLGKAQSKSGITSVEVRAYAHDTDLQALASMIMIMERGAANDKDIRIDISLSDPLSATAPLSSELDNRKYISAAADWSALQRAYFDAPRPKGGTFELSRTYLPWIQQLFEGKLEKGEHGYFLSEDDDFLASICELLVLRLLSIIDESNGCAAAIVESHCNSSAMPTFDIRRVLVENNVIDAVIEFEHIEGQNDRSGQGTALWILRFGRKAGDGILLARLSGDGFDNLCESLCGGEWEFYDHLGLSLEENPVAQRVIDMVVNRELVDMVGVVVSPDDIAKSEDYSFRFASYQDSVDLNTRFAQKAEGWGDLQKRLSDSVKQSRACDKRFLGALEAFNDSEA